MPSIRLVSAIPWVHSSFIQCTYQCYTPQPCTGYVGHQIPLRKVGDYWGFDTCCVTVQYMETIAIIKMSLEVIKYLTIDCFHVTS